jgi:hypothetical protein
MNKEEKIVRLIVKLFSGEISPTENEEINNWKAESPENLRSFREQEN